MIHFLALGLSTGRQHREVDTQLFADLLLKGQDFELLTAQVFFHVSDEVGHVALPLEFASQLLPKDVEGLLELLRETADFLRDLTLLVWRYSDVFGAVA